MVETLLALFPGLRQSEFHVTSPATRAYNCIAWAACDEAEWWWPDPDLSNAAVYWPAGVPREETLAAFLAVFALRGFVPCAGEEFEAGFERVALYALADGTPTHAARQLASGLWTSKLGALEDITHPLHALSGNEYGTVVQILKRPASEV